MGHDIPTDRILLSTKLKIPTPRKDYIVRRELFEILYKGLSMQVTYVNGSAGTGKTTLLASFIKEAAMQKVKWLSLDKSNDNLYSFWYYFAAAIGEFLGKECEDILSIFRTNYEASNIENLLAVIINRLCSEEHYYIVLDDVQEIKDQRLIETIEFFLKAIPDNFHFFMLSREKPIIYMGEQAVSGRLLLIDAENMKFSSSEGLLFLKKTLKLTCSDEILGKMKDFADGWVGGLQLIAAAECLNKDFDFLAYNSMTAEYLTREIFNSLNGEEQHFLTVTGILSVFDEELCCSMIENLSFKTIIEGLIAKNLFIVRIDEENCVYRYHNLLSVYLKQQFGQLDKAIQIQFHLKAACCLETRGEYEEAVFHLFAAEEYSRARDMLKRMEETIDTWLLTDKLPIPVLLSDLNLTVQCLMYNIGILNITRLRTICKAFEEKYGDSLLLNVLHHVYIYIGDKKDSSGTHKIMTVEEIENLNLSPVTQSLLLLEHANALVSNGYYAIAEEYVDKGLKTCNGTNLCSELYILSIKAQLLEETGRLNESLEVYIQMDRLFHSVSAMELIGTHLRSGCVGVYMRRMEAKKAKEFLDHNPLFGQNVMTPAIIDFGYEYHMAEYEILFGDTEKGNKIIGDLINSNSSVSIMKFDRLLTVLYAYKLLTDEFRVQFIKEYTSKEHDHLPLSSRLLYARIMMGKGEYDEALMLLEKIMAFSRTNKNMLRLVEADLLKIQILAPKQEDMMIIHNLFREAIYYTSENRIMQPFYLDSGSLLPLLKEYSKNCMKDLSSKEQEFVMDILDICVNKSQGITKDVLTPREYEVLVELANGLTNSQISKRLGISLATVKTHIIKIYEKLDASSRISAIDTAKRRGYIDN